MTEIAPVIRKIIHVDMDAFFASVEQRDNPHLRGKPVVVGGSPKGRGVVAACSYEARKFGIHSAMSCAEAYRRCRETIFVSPRFDAYKEVSSQIRSIFFRYTDLVEPLSLDEAYLDVTQNHLALPSATWIARRIKSEIKQETGLTASAGVSSLKFLAKIASDMNKPDGLTVIPPEQVYDTITHLPVGKIFGVGKITEARLMDMGILTGGDLRSCHETELLRRFGKHGHFFRQLACGIDDRPVRPGRKRKSVSVENTYDQDLRDMVQIREALAELVERLMRRLQRSEAKGRTLTLKLRLNDFSTFTRSRSLTQAWKDETGILGAATAMAQKLIEENHGSQVRLLGIGISKLMEERSGNEHSPDENTTQLPLPF